MTSGLGSGLLASPLLMRGDSLARLESLGSQGAGAWLSRVLALVSAARHVMLGGGVTLPLWVSKALENLRLHNCTRFATTCARRLQLTTYDTPASPVTSRHAVPCCALQGLVLV